MQPHASRASSDSPSSGTGKPLPSIPAINTFSPRSPDSGNSTSPSIKRKPLPPSAFSPPPVSGYPGHTDDTTNERSLILPSANTLNQVLEAAPQTDYNDETPGNYYTPADDPRSYYFSTSPTDLQPEVSFQDFPEPPAAPALTPPDTDEDPYSGREEKGMGLKPGERPPPLRMDSINSVKSVDMKKPQSPGNKFTSFFMRKPQTSPTANSAVTDISDGHSPMPSPYPQSETGSGSFAVNSYFNFGLGRSNTAGSQDSIEFKKSTSDSRCSALEAELKEISVELAHSIRRELDLEDIVERLQSDNPYPIQADRTSDYFSDSGTSSLRADGSELSAKDELDKIKREAEQHKAQLKIELSQKWQDEASRSRTVEAAYDDVRRKLSEERKARENFENLSQALSRELEQHRQSSDSVPQLRARIQSLESSLANQQQLQLEVQNLRDENAALVSAREMERGLNRGSMSFIAEEGSSGMPRMGGLQRTSTVTGRGNRGSLARSGSLSRTNSTANRGGHVGDIDEKIKDTEKQRDALHNTVKYLLKRQEIQKKQFAKRTHMLEIELERAQTTAPQPRKGGYEREVRVLRAEINTLRKRADDALDQKWQCEKGLAGLKMDLDRNKQETASLQKLLQAKGSDPDVQGLMSATLEQAIVEMQKERARIQDSSKLIQQEERLAEQIEEYASRQEALARQVKKQLQSNAALRTRLKNAVENGEHNQEASADSINTLQSKLKKLEDQISSAQTTSETAVMKHEEEIRVLKASHNAQLMRALSTSKKGNNNANNNLTAPTNTPGAKSPLSPMFANSKRSPRLDKTSSGPGMALHEALRTEFLEDKVTDLERALAETESEIGKIIAKMNQAQMNVADLEAERDEALRLTRQLENQVQEERTRYADLIKVVNQW